MAEWAGELAVHLISRGLATAKGTDIFTGFWPEDRDNVILIRDTGGFPPESKLPDLKRTAQIFARNRDYDAAYTKIWGIFNALDIPGQRYIAINGRQMVVRAIQPPILLGTDAKGRIEFVFNISAWTSRD